MLQQLFLLSATITRPVREWVARRADDGASLVEYALLLALIAVVAIGALVFLGHSVNNTLNQVANSINSTATTTAP